MKKIMLLAATTALFASSIYAEEEQVYVTVGGGATLLQKDKISNPNVPTIPSVRLKKTNISPIVSIGVGYGLMDMVRGELEYSHYFDAENKSKNKDLSNGNSANYSGKVKYNADIIMFKGIVDLFDAGPAKFFVGAGVGYAQLRSKDIVTYNSNIAGPDLNGSNSFKAKKASNIAYTLLAGVAFDLSEDMKLDVSYNYTDAGKTKNYRYNEVNVGTKTHFRAHTAKVGLRFAF